MRGVWGRAFWRKPLKGGRRLGLLFDLLRQLLPCLTDQARAVFDESSPVGPRSRLGCLLLLAWRSQPSAAMGGGAAIPSLQERAGLVQAGLVSVDWAPGAVSSFILCAEGSRNSFFRLDDTCSSASGVSGREWRGQG